MPPLGAGATRSSANSIRRQSVAGSVAIPDRPTAMRISVSSACSRRISTAGPAEPVNDFETPAIAIYRAVSPVVDLAGGLIQTASGSGRGLGMPRTKRSG